MTSSGKAGLALFVRVAAASMAMLLPPVYAQSNSHSHGHSHGHAHGHAHVHGQAALQIAIQAGNVTATLTSPLDSLVGFEHAPRTDAQKAAVQTMRDRFAKPELLLVPTAEARCVITGQSLVAPVLGLTGAGGAAVETAAVKGAEKPSGKAGDASRKDKETHAELTASFTFRCEQPESLKGLEVRLFDAFRGLRRVDAQVAGSRGQKAQRLTASQRMLGLP